MDATTSEGISPAATLHLHNIPDIPVAAMELRIPSFPCLKRHCFGDSTPGEFPLSSCPSIVLHVLTTCGLGPRDLAKLEATCSFFRKSAKFSPDFELSISEVAALDLCQKRVIFKRMGEDERQEIKRKCGGSWKLVLKFLLAGEYGSRREKSQALAGPGHSITVTSKGVVYSFGSNSSGQLGQGTTEDAWQPRPLRSLNGIRIIQAAVSPDRTMLISDAGEVYAFGKDGFSQAGLEGSQETKLITTPQRVKSLTEIFVVQAAIGNYFTAVLSREGRVYTLSWGSDDRLGHKFDLNCKLPHPLLGALEDVPVVQIAAGFCYLLALACQPTGMSVYSVGCGLGGKLGHGSSICEKQPRLIEQFSLLNMEPIMISAGLWHAAALGKDGRVCTWGWGRYGCLGHGSEEQESVPKVVEGLKDVKAVHVDTGEYTTMVVADDGQVYSFGCGESANLGQGDVEENTLTPKLVTSLKKTKERVVHVSLTNSRNWSAHTFAMTESGRVYAFGGGHRGQLGVQLGDNLTERVEPERVMGIDLS